MASYDSCANDNIPALGYIGDAAVFAYIPLYLQDATARIANYIADGFQLTVNDTYAMQSICAYETAALGSSSFCGLFTQACVGKLSLSSYQELSML